MSPFSTRIQAEVLASFPEWRQYATTERWKESEPYFVVVVPAPSEANTELPLRISTWDDEVTVEFDYYHAHFERWEPVSGDTKQDSALSFVRALLTEELGVASWWQGERCKLCAQYNPGEPLSAPFKIEYTRVRVRSWRGKLNEERVA